MLLEQIAPKPPALKKKPAKQKSPAGQPLQRGRGRPKGSKNKNQRNVKLNDEMTRVKAMLKRLLTLLGDTLEPVYFVYDGAFGNNAAVQMTQSVGLHLISKLRNHSALHFEWDGIYAGRGCRPKYGERVDYKNLPQRYLKSDEVKGAVRTRIYQFTAVHKAFADKLNVVKEWERLQATTNLSLKQLLLSDQAETDDLIIPPRGKARRRNVQEVI